MANINNVLLSFRRVQFWQVPVAPCQIVNYHRLGRYQELMRSFLSFWGNLLHYFSANNITLGAIPH